MAVLLLLLPVLAPAPHIKVLLLLMLLFLGLALALVLMLLIVPLTLLALMALLLLLKQLASLVWPSQGLLILPLPRAHLAPLLLLRSPPSNLNCCLLAAMALGSLRA